MNLTDDQKEALYELARKDRQMCVHLDNWGQRFHSVNDPIDAEIYRIRCELYCILAAGADVNQAFQAHYARAEEACNRFNAKQAKLYVKSWQVGITGHRMPEEAYNRLHHAVQMYKQITCAKRTPRINVRLRTRIMHQHHRRAAWYTGMGLHVWNAYRQYIWRYRSRWTRGNR